MNVLEQIKQLRELRGWSEYMLSEKAEIPQSTISSWYKKDMLPSISSLEKICKGFGITMSQFFSENNEAIELTQKQHEMLERWDSLSETQKDTLLEFLKTI